MKEIELIRKQLGIPKVRFCYLTGIPHKNYMLMLDGVIVYRSVYVQNDKIKEVQQMLIKIIDQKINRLTILKDYIT